MSWGEVPAIDRNGIITQYEVEYEPLETFGGQIATMMTTTNATTFEQHLDNLEEYVVYSITVRAKTTAGIGVPSTPVLTQTDEDGELSR